MFQFSYDPDKNLLRVVQRGYWTIPVFRAYEAEYLKRHASIRKVHRNYRVIANCSDFPVQSAEVGEAFRLLFEKLMEENKGRCAIVAGTTLNKLQAKRTIPQSNVQTFVDPDEAMRWLCEDGSVHGH